MGGEFNLSILKTQYDFLPAFIFYVARVGEMAGCKSVNLRWSVKGHPSF